MSIPGCLYLDLEANLTDFEADAWKVVSQVRPQWKQQDVVFKRFTKGQINHLLGCRLRDDTEAEDMILVRVYGEGSEILTDRLREMSCIYILNKSDQSKPLYARFRNGIAYGYMPGECISTDTVRDPHISRLIAEHMAQYGSIHKSAHMKDLPVEFQARLLDRNFSFFQLIRDFIDIAGVHQPWKTDPDIPDDTVLRSEVDLLERELTTLGSPIIFCHNDLLLNNIIYDKNSDRCSFIDFEMSSFNYQACDIATHFCEWAGLENTDCSLYPDKETQLTWLKHYLTEYKLQQGADVCTPSDRELQTLYVQVNKFSLVAHLASGIFFISDTENNFRLFNYYEYAKLRFREYFKKKDERLSLTLPD